MCAKMHVDEAEIDQPLVERLIATQFPQWATLPIRPVRSAGTDNAMYRLGDEMAVRLPRTVRVTPQMEKEHRWLPTFAPHLPLDIPLPLAKGEPGEGYPWHWAVYRWLEGENITLETLADPHHAARDLAQFLRVLQQLDTIGGPLPGDHNFGRGIALAARDGATRRAIGELGELNEIDVALVTAVWEASLNAPVWDAPGVWIHGDLSPGNLLAQAGRISAVIDFGGLAVGDPACDLLVAWNLLDAESRATLRTALGVDDATWLRGRGWALSVALIALPYYLKTNPVIVATSRRVLAEVLTDYARVR